jgi:transposase
VIERKSTLAVQRSKNWLVMFYHTINQDAGKKAITATARKIAVIFYKLIKEKTAFNPINVTLYTETSKNNN